MSNLTLTGVSHLELYVSDLDASVGVVRVRRPAVPPGDTTRAGPWCCSHKTQAFVLCCDLVAPPTPTETSATSRWGWTACRTWRLGPVIWTILVCSTRASRRGQRVTRSILWIPTATTSSSRTNPERSPGRIDRARSLSTSIVDIGKRVRAGEILLSLGVGFSPFATRPRPGSPPAAYRDFRSYFPVGKAAKIWKGIRAEA